MPMYLRQWSQERATGTLTVVSTGQDPSVSTVLVEDGAVVFATSRRRRDPTGELFLELFQVPELDPDSVEEVARIRRQVTRIVAELFNMPVADVSYADGIHLSRWPKMSLSVGSLLLSGMRHVRDTDRILSWIGSADQVFVTTTDPFSFFNVELSVDEAYFLSRIADRVRLEDLLSMAIIEREHAIRLVAALLFAGAIEPAEDFPSAPPAAQPASSAPAIDPAEAAQFWYRVEEKLNDIARGVDHYGLLGVNRSDSIDEIHQHYETVARDFHPDRYRFLAPAGINVEGQLDEIFDALTIAYIVLTNPRYREIYDRQLADQRAAAGVRVPSKVASPRPAPAPSPKPPPRAVQPPAKPPPGQPAPSSGTPEPVRPAPQAASPTVPSSPVPPPPASRPAPDPAVFTAPTGQLSISDLIERGVAWAASGDHDRAVKALERAILLAPENPRLHMALGHSLAHIPNQRRRAEAILLQCTTMSPFAVQPIVDLANIYIETGRTDEAREMLKRAVSLKPNDKLVRELQSNMSQVEKRGASHLFRRFFQKPDS